MKLFTLVLGVLLFASCVHVSTNSPSANINGTWKGVYKNNKKGEPSEQHFTFKFKQDGNSLTGTACDTTTKPGEWVELEDIIIKGNTIKFTRKPEPRYRFFYKGKIEDNKIQLAFNLNVGRHVNVDIGEFTIQREI